MQLLIGQNSYFARLALPDQRRLIFPPGLHVAVKTVVRKVNLPAYKPLSPRHIPFQHAIPLLEPVQLFRNTPPEFFRLLHGFAINVLVLRQTLNVGMLAELGWWFELTLLLKNRINVGFDCRRGSLFCHDGSPRDGWTRSNLVILLRGGQKVCTVGGPASARMRLWRRVMQGQLLEAPETCPCLEFP